MQLTRFGHSCVRLERDGMILVLDPGTAQFADAAAALVGADAVLVTHKHPDHLDVDAVRAAHAANANLQVVAPHDALEALDGLGSAVRGVCPGEAFEIAGFGVRTVGGEHAEIYPGFEVPQNIGYVIDGGALYHPGDSFDPAGAAVDALLVPVQAPWSKISEVIAFVRAVAPTRALAIHDGGLNDLGLGLVDRHVGTGGGARYDRLPRGESVDL